MPDKINEVPILGTAVIPWTPDWEFDEPLFRRGLRRLATELTPHLYIFGTAGEGYAVSEAQFRQIAAAFLDVAGECGASPMVGVISLSLRTVIERITWARELGCRSFQISLPSWGALNDCELETFFAETCGRFSDCSFLHYNLARSGRVLGAAEYRRLAGAHPNLVAVKYSPTDETVIRELVQTVPRLRFFMTEFSYAVARRHGPCGLLVALSTIHYRRAREFVACSVAVRESYVAELRGIHAELLRLADGRFHMDGAYDQLLHKINEAGFPLRLLPPYEGGTEADYRQLLAALPERWRPYARDSRS